jgi:hypothetical protein
VPSYNELFNHFDDWNDSLYEKEDAGETDLRRDSGMSIEAGHWLEGIEASRNLLSKYYSKTDSRLYSCVTFCDPIMRGYYRTDAGYEPIWIHKARCQVEDV